MWLYGYQDTEAFEHQAYFELPQRSRTGWIDGHNVKLFLGKPLDLTVSI
jgi:hypothetical protein